MTIFGNVKELFQFLGYYTIVFLRAIIFLDIISKVLVTEIILYLEFALKYR